MPQDFNRTRIDSGGAGITYNDDSRRVSPAVSGLLLSGKFVGESGFYANGGIRANAFQAVGG